MLGVTARLTGLPAAGSRVLSGALSGRLADRPGRRSVQESAPDKPCPNMVRGIDNVRETRLNKGMAFTLEERQRLGIHGLLPPRFKTQDEQVDLCLKNISRYQEDLNKFIYLMGLQDRNERLFYRVLSENVEQMMPLVYTPTVGLACQKFGLIYRRPRGLFITIHDKGHIYDVMRNWPEQDVRAIVVTDGERILGLGDLGAQGMGIPVGKLSLYTALAGIKPQQCLPIVLDVGTNNKDLLNDEFYIGLKQNRVTGEAYDEFVDEFMQAAVRRYGQKTLIQFEDFGNHNAFRFLDKYRNKYCTFNDDIQGTASVAVAGLLAAMRKLDTKLSDHTFLFLGAGEASLGIANLCVMAMEQEGLSSQAAHDKIFMVDSRGLIVKNRPEGGVTGHKVDYAKDMEPMKNLGDVVKKLKPSALIGAAAQPQAFTAEILKDMGEYNKEPIIFALSNPTSMAECTAEQAYQATQGRAVFASGSPFAPVTINGKTLYPGQGNNAYIFPGVALGVIASGMHHIGEDVFLRAAEALAKMVTDQELDAGRLYPPLENIRDVSLQIAVQLAEHAYKTGEASVYPHPDDLLAYIETHRYDFSYESPLLNTYEWPSSGMVH
ncbi:NADP-dependent malic enzyme-like isoform X1 [Amphibalanus amphitrite]|uniref:NADP-dependent malic enzyme-like isoform X1 n=1 Tax=Amphibalanus amphitrite TaxID=1232801 RepID=UPI001C926316|nr:NADP-dependent malic enzyme-like isoform X1 [Amphibalanus amphitrite]XP_043223700.1 NADP-dependent malic enzyme-like isoform X1 [Amphibalanus amphitrite]